MFMQIRLKKNAAAAGEKKYSYIRKPYAKNGFYSLPLAAVSLFLFAGVLLFSIRGGGNSGLTAGAVGISSLLSAGMGIWFTRLGFGEKERNYLFVKIGGAVSGIVLLLWAVIIVIGLGA